ncbi:SRPBCC family protein [Microdochium nivale]|nr:SRPBCC family protein [Microdochium nivale]
MVYHAQVPPIEIAAPPARVREIFLDFKNMGQWHTSHFKSLDIVTPGRDGGIDLRRGDEMRVNLGNYMNFGATIVENSPERLTWRGGVSYLLIGEHTFEFRPSESTPGGTTFVQHEEFTGLLTFGMQGNKEATASKSSGGFQRVNNDLKKRAESDVAR